jgi:hypothetical protein
MAKNKKRNTPMNNMNPTNMTLKILSIKLGAWFTPKLLSSILDVTVAIFIFKL